MASEQADNERQRINTGHIYITLKTRGKDVVRATHKPQPFMSPCLTFCVLSSIIPYTFNNNPVVSPMGMQLKATTQHREVCPSNAQRARENVPSPCPSLCPMILASNNAYHMQRITGKLISSLFVPLPDLVLGENA